MNRDEFLKILQEGLKDFPEVELNDILYDYKEHFDAALASGKTNEEIINELGNPNDLVNQYRSGYIQKYDGPTTNNNKSNTNDYTNQNNNFKNNTSNYKKSSTDTTNQIIKLLLIITGLIILGPIATGIIATIFGIFVGFLGLTFGITAGGVALLLGSSVTNILGFFTIPAFIAEFPISVIALITLGGFLGFIFNILVAYYLCKLFYRYMKKFVNWVAPKIRGEK